MKIAVLNTYDEKALNRALGMKAHLFLMQDAVLFTNARIESNKRLSDANVYALREDVAKRGLIGRVLNNVKLVDIDETVDLLFSSENVVNL